MDGFFEWLFRTAFSKTGGMRIKISQFINSNPKLYCANQINQVVKLSRLDADAFFLRVLIGEIFLHLQHMHLQKTMTDVSSASNFKKKKVSSSFPPKLYFPIFSKTVFPNLAISTKFVDTPDESYKRSRKVSFGEWPFFSKNVKECGARFSYVTLPAVAT